MHYNLCKKTVVKGEKKYLNFYLVSTTTNKIIPIEIKKFFTKDNKLSLGSKIDFNIANETADWLTGEDSHKDFD